MADRPEPPRQVVIHGGRAGGDDIAYCPQCTQLQSCSFDTRNCDGTRQGYDFCAADSRDHRQCTFTGVCVGNRW